MKDNTQVLDTHVLQSIHHKQKVEASQNILKNILKEVLPTEVFKYVLANSMFDHNEVFTVTDAPAIADETLVGLPLPHTGVSHLLSALKDFSIPNPPAKLFVIKTVPVSN